MTGRQPTDGARVVLSDHSRPLASVPLIVLPAVIYDGTSILNPLIGDPQHTISLAHLGGRRPPRPRAPAARRRPGSQAGR